MGCKWVLKHEGEGPFSGINLEMSAISTQVGAEGLGVSHYEESLTKRAEQIVTHPESMTKGNDTET